MQFDDTKLKQVLNFDAFWVKQCNLQKRKKKQFGQHLNLSIFKEYIKTNQNKFHIEHKKILI